MASGVAFSVLLSYVLLHPPISRAPALPQATPAVQPIPVFTVVIPETRQRMAVHRAIAPTPVEAAAVPPAQSTVSADDDVSLYADLKSYNLEFRGKMTYNGTPCSGRLELQVTTDHNPNIYKTIPIQSDGSYAISVPIHELDHAQVDWRLIAHSGMARTADINSRHILLDDSTVVLEQDIPLRS